MSKENKEKKYIVTAKMLDGKLRTFIQGAVDKQTCRVICNLDTRIERVIDIGG